MVALGEGNQAAHYKRSTQPSLNVGSTPVPTGDWKEFTSLEGAFTASFPGMPTQTTPSGTTNYSHDYTFKRGRCAFLVTYQDLLPETAAKGPRAIYDDIVAQYHETVKSKKDVDLDGNTNDAATPLYFDQAHLDAGGNPDPSLIVSAAPPATAFQVFEVTSLAVLPNGSQKLLQYIVTPATLNLQLASALILNSNNASMGGGTSTGYQINERK